MTTRREWTPRHDEQSRGQTQIRRLEDRRNVRFPAPDRPAMAARGRRHARIRARYREQAPQSPWPGAGRRDHDLRRPNLRHHRPLRLGQADAGDRAARYALRRSRQDRRSPDLEAACGTLHPQSDFHHHRGDRRQTLYRDGERRVQDIEERNVGFVIASEAKQSILSLPIDGLLRRFAPRNDVAAAEDPPMQYRQLGRSGLKISPICLGTMMFGGPTDEATSSRIVAKAREAGINFIDSADAYNGGQSEQVVGRAISNNRSSWILATELANQIGDDPNRGGLSRRWVLQAAEESLKRLGTDFIDIYYLHKEDHATPLAETVRAIGDLIRQGKIRYFGVSNYRAWRVAEICNLCDQNGIDRPIVSQPYYNAMNRMPEVEHFPACGYYGLGIVPYSPLARGVLTGKYAPDAAPPADTRAGRADKRMMQTEWRPESLQLAQEIKQHAESKGITAGQFAVAWVLNSAFVTGVVAGPRTEEHWDDYLRALDYRFTAEDEALIDGLVVSGHPSTPGLNDPAYPIEGRRARTDTQQNA